MTGAAIAHIRKAIVAGIAAGVFAAGAALPGIDAIEWGTIAGATVATGLLTWLTRNGPKPVRPSLVREDDATL